MYHGDLSYVTEEISFNVADVFVFTQSVQLVYNDILVMFAMLLLVITSTNNIMLLRHLSEL